MKSLKRKNLYISRCRQLFRKECPTGNEQAQSKYLLRLPSFSHVQGQLHPVVQILFVEDATDVTLYGS